MILESREVTKKYGSKTAWPQWKRQDHLDENGSRTCKAY